MQVLKAGANKLLLLELDPEFLENIARQAGFEFRLDDQARRVVLDLNAESRQTPLLLFDAPTRPTSTGFRAASSTSTASAAACCKLRFS